MEPLPPRQAAVLEYLRRYLREHSSVPSVRSVAEKLGYASHRGVTEILEKLEAKGAIEREAGSYRSLRILWPDPACESVMLRPQHQIPLLGRIAAGAPMTAGFDATEEGGQHLDIDPGLFPSAPDAFVEINGHSMINAGINDGDLLGISFRQEFKNRQIVAAVIIDERTGDPTRTIKRYEKKGSIITLHSENDDQELYKPLVFDTRKDHIEVFALWTSLIKRQVQ